MTGPTARSLRPPSAPVHGTLFVPAAVAPAAGVLVIGGSGGSEPSYVARALADEGFAALSVSYFGRPGLPAELRGIALEYFAGAVELLRSEVGLSGLPLAIIGMSRGSEAAMLTAIRMGDALRAVVVSVPGNVVAGSWPPGGPAWLAGGRALPYAGAAEPEPGEAVPEEAIIPVEQVRGPVLLVGAGADRVWPSAAMARALAERLVRHGDRYGHVLLEYPLAGHALGYLIPRLPDGLLPPDLADDPADQTARADAWPRLLEFLRGFAGVHDHD